MTKFNNWITCPHPEPGAKVRLFCLPFAGGGASIYRSWGKLIGNEIEVCPIQLPGRENRFSDTPIKQAQAMAQTLANQIQLYSNKPFFIYGHSMGALIAFELTRALQDNGLDLPQGLILAAHRAAHLPRKREALYALPDDQFIDRLKRFGGFPQEVLDSKELLAFLMPTLKADFTLCDTYQFESRLPLQCPLHLLAGADDIEASPDVVEPWKEHTSDSAHMHVLSAGHFFLRTHQEDLIRILQNIMSPAMANKLPNLHV